MPAPRRRQADIQKERLDALFGRFMLYIFIIMLLFGGGMAVVTLYGNNTLALKMINVFATMFSGLVGLGSGYLLGSRK